MLNKKQKNLFGERAKAVAKSVLSELDITELSEDNDGLFLDEITLRVNSLVSTKADGFPIDEELLDIYDLLTDIILDNENDIAFLNELFLKA